jgi:hypothetical protein
MYATCVSLLIALGSFLLGIQLDSLKIFILAVVFGVAILLLAVYLYATTLSPLQRGEQKITPRLVELFSSDLKLKILFSALLVLPLLLVGSSLIPSTISFGILIVLIGISLDFLRGYARRLTDYFNPFRVTEFLGAEAVRAVNNNQNLKLSNLIEATSEIALHSIGRHNSALANQAIDILEKMGKKFLASSFSRTGQSQESRDTIRYILLFLLQHLEAIHTNATHKKLDLVAGHVVTTLSKLARYASEADFSLVLLPLHYIDKCTLDALRKGFPDVGIKGTIGLLELAKALTQQKGLEYQDIKAPMIKLITTLEAISKETFRNDKSTNIQVLMTPFIELSQLMEQGAFKGHADTPFIIQQINRIIGEFQTLDAVMKTMPPLPKITSEDEPAMQTPSTPPSPGAG